MRRATGEARSRPSAPSVCGTGAAAWAGSTDGTPWTGPTSVGRSEGGSGVGSGSEIASGVRSAPAGPFEGDVSTFAIKLPIGSVSPSCATISSTPAASDS